MKQGAFMARITGYYEKLGSFDYFIPYSLPPKDPSLVYDGNLYGIAMHWLGLLKGQVVPNRRRFIKSYLIKEALLSSAIEGIHTTTSDIFAQAVVGTKPTKEAGLVLNCLQALDVALEEMRAGLPICNRLILKAHKELMSGQGEKADPGNFRKQAVRVGALIPPSSPHIVALMSDLERFINEDVTLPPLIKAGLAHVQFETIHPFLDGNGRIGRLLIVLMLIEAGMLEEPIIYPSYYFKRTQQEYYRRLDAVRTEGDFEGWTTYFLTAIVESCKDAYYRSQQINELEQEIRPKIAPEILGLLFEFPVFNIRLFEEKLNVVYNTAKSEVDQLIELGIVQQSGDQKRNKLFSFTRYLELLSREHIEIPKTRI